MSNSNLKTHKQIKYSNKLHSYDLWTVLIGLLFQAAAPLSAYSNLSIEAALSCLALSTDNRRKVAYENSSEFLVNVFYETSLRVIDDSEESKLDLLDYLLISGVERNVIVDHIAFSLATSKLPSQMDKRKLKHFVQLYLTYYEEFKQDIIYRYYHLTESSAFKNYYNKLATGLNSSKLDMFHVYVISLMRAIDRFIPYEGTLTEYINQWFQNAKGSSDYIVYDGEAITINRTVRRMIQKGEKSINTKSIPIEDRENSLTDDSKTDELVNNNSEYIRYIANLPGSTIVFLALNLPYILNDSQKKRVKDAC